MGRTMRDFRNYWSGQHHALLLFTAKRVLRRYPASNITIDELVNVGWLRGLRRVPPEHLNGCYKYLFLIMITYVHKEEQRKLPDWDTLLENTEDYREKLEYADCIIDAQDLLESLSLMERSILLERLKGKTLRQIGSKRGLSGERIRQLQKCAITTMKLRDLVQRRKHG